MSVQPDKTKAHVVRDAKQIVADRQARDRATAAKGAAALAAERAKRRPLRPTVTKTVSTVSAAELAKNAEVERLKQLANEVDPFTARGYRELAEKVASGALPVDREARAALTKAAIDDRDRHLGVWSSHGTNSRR